MRHMRLRLTLVLLGSLTTLFAIAVPAADASVEPGVTYTGEGTYYGATGQGNCSFDATDDIAIAALNHTDYDNAAMCGAYVHVTGPDGSITVKIVDRCPECAQGDVDLSEEAFDVIADPVDGRVAISWSLVSPDIDGPVSYRYKEGSSEWWCGIQVRNHRNPVAKLEVLTDSGWQELPREEYNYFVSSSGEGCGSDIRITDVYGQTLTDTGITITPGTDQPGAAQFDQH